MKIYVRIFVQRLSKKYLEMDQQYRTVDPWHVASIPIFNIISHQRVATFLHSDIDRIVFMDDGHQFKWKWIDWTKE